MDQLLIHFTLMNNNPLDLWSLFLYIRTRTIIIMPLWQSWRYSEVQWCDCFHCTLIAPWLELSWMNRGLDRRADTFGIKRNTEFDPAIMNQSVTLRQTSESAKCNLNTMCCCVCCNAAATAMSELSFLCWKNKPKKSCKETWDDDLLHTKRWIERDFNLMYGNTD